MPIELTDQQALELIDMLTGDDFCEEMDMVLLSDAGQEWPPELKTAMEKLAQIYRIAHSHVSSHSCFKNHSDWRTEAAKAYEEISKL